MAEVKRDKATLRSDGQVVAMVEVDSDGQVDVDTFPILGEVNLVRMYSEFCGACVRAGFGVSK